MTIATIVATLLPSHPDLDEKTRLIVGSDVAAFVASQVQALPDFLRMPYRLGLFAFEWLPVARWGRGFRGLDGDRRVAYVASWSDSRLGAPRNFMKLLRGCTFLAYYDHPLVRARLEQVPEAAPQIRSSVGFS